MNLVEKTVEKIVIENGSATGIKSKSGIDKADIVVCNADFPYAIKELIKDNEAKGKYTDKKISKMKYSCSTFIMHLGLKKKYPTEDDLYFVGNSVHPGTGISIVLLSSIYWHLNEVIS